MDTHIRRASVVNRVIAEIIDAFVVGIPSLCLVAVLKLLLDGTPVETAWNLIYIGVAFFYEAILLTRFGQTVGKKLCWIKVSVADTDIDAHPAFRTAALRSIVKAPNIVFVLPVLAIFGPVWAAIIFVTIVADPRRRGWHDKVAGTYVLSSTPVLPTEKTDSS